MFDICIKASELATFIDKDVPWYDEKKSRDIFIWSNRIIAQNLNIPIEKKHASNVEERVDKASTNVLDKLCKETGLRKNAPKKEIVEKLEKEIVSVAVNKPKSSDAFTVVNTMKPAIEKMIGKEVKEDVRINRGIKNERDTLDKMENERNTKISKRNDMLYRKVLFYYKGIPVKLIGKIDGFEEENDTIIEIKNRFERLKYKLYTTEKIQLYCYMFLLGKNKGILRECLDDITCDHKIDSFDHNFWDWCMKSLRSFLDEVLDEVLQDEGSIGEEEDEDEEDGED